MKEESDMKINHVINEGFHFSSEIKTEIKDVMFIL